MTKTDVKEGSYAYDANFLNEHKIGFVELTSQDGNSRVMVAPSLQGRVMTSSASGEEGTSFGWLNYRFIEKGEKSDQFNPIGGEERFWLAPEGGPFSLYFAKGKEQVYDNWHVPAVIDTEAYKAVAQSDSAISFEKETSLVNAMGTTFDMKIQREVKLLTKAAVERGLDIAIPDGLSFVAYQTDNKVTNTGKDKWNKDKGLVSIWLLSQFTPTPSTTVFIPYKQDVEGRLLNDSYFGKIPAERLIVKDGVVYFRIDGKYRSKLGMSPKRAKGICGSYDSSKGILTILTCTMGDDQSVYLNGQWGKQDDPFDGDAINSYNDGPLDDGSIMGPFYEVETSSPAVELAKGQTLEHVQKTIHIQGSPEQLNPIVKRLFGIDLSQVTSQFKN